MAMTASIRSVEGPAAGAPLRTLHVDIEGGWGGSSRSLYELIRRFDRDRIAPLVAHRESGPVEARYAAIGVPTARVPEIGSYVPRARKALRNLVASVPRLRRLDAAAEALAGLARAHRADLVHLNYEGLFLLAGKLKRRTGLPMAIHCRAHLPESLWGRWVARTVAREADHVFFISPQEKARFEALVGDSAVPREVVWNIAPPLVAPNAKHAVPEAIYLGSIDPEKGTDRLIDIAAALESAAAPPLLIAVYGRARAQPRYLESLRRRVAAARLDDRIAFRGHTAEPEQVLAGAFALIRPSRTNDPWGRDVIEATSFGVPVLATGSFDGVVEPGVTGYLFDPFDAEAMAARLMDLLAQPELRARMSAAARQKGARQFSGDRQVEAVTAAFMSLVSRSHEQ